MNLRYLHGDTAQSMLYHDRIVVYSGSEATTIGFLSRTYTTMVPHLRSISTVGLPYEPHSSYVGREAARAAAACAAVNI